MTAPLILGHRGASSLAPENTLAAFAQAMNDGADGIEFDVRLARDGVPVVIHDASLKRTGLRDVLVKDLTAEALQRIDVGSWFNARGTVGSPSFENELLPGLTQVFDLFKGNAGLLYLEMKPNPLEIAALAAAVAEMTRTSGLADRVVIECFELQALEEIKRIDPGLRTAALFEPRLSHPITTVRRSKLVETALRVGADEIALHHTLAAPHVIERARLAGVDVVIWTVDDPIWVSRAIALKVKALIANHPGLMVQHRRAQA